MAAVSPSAAHLRPSLWEGSSNPFLHSPMDSDETVRQIRYNKPLPIDPGPSTSLAPLRGSSADEFGTRTRPTLRNRKSKDSVLSLNTASKRTSFIDLTEGQHPPTGIIGSLKGKLSKKRSAPMLSNSLSAPSIYTTTPDCMTTGDSSGGSSPSTSFPQDSYFSLRSKPSKSFRNERKRTAIPEEIVDGIGHGIRFPTKPHDETAPAADDDTDISQGKYRAVPLRKRHGTLVHSYAPSDAPYAQSYNKVDLQSDFYFDTLLKRLKPKDAPSFHDYKVPPQEILDLGCGDGSWVKDAAAAWSEPGTRVVGFDLVDLVSKDSDGPSNAAWTLGNYVSYSLPFKSNTFNLVRLSNLSVTVPESRWEHLLTEVHRVLKPHGRVEIIDDELMFPYPDQAEKSSLALTPTSQRFSKRTSWTGSARSTASKDSDATLEEPKLEEPSSSFLDMDDSPTADFVPPLCEDSGSSSDSLSSPEGLNDAATLAESEATTMVDGLLDPSQMISQTVEKVYESVLEHVHQVNPRPADFLEDLMWKVFGEGGRTKQIKDFKLSLLNKHMHDAVVESKRMGVRDNSLQESPKRSKLFKADREVKRVDNDRAFIDKMAIANTRGKALRLLGADATMPTQSFDPLGTQFSDMSDFTTIDTVSSRGQTHRKRASTLFSTASPRPSSSSSASSHSKNTRHTPTGLFLFPDQFLETTPSELERYLFKHTDSVLSSKTALDAHVLKLADEKGQPAVTEEEWADLLWEYERSRRERFNLPDVGGRWDDYDEDEDEDALREPGRNPRKLIPAVVQAILNDKASNSTLVRHIRVFEAYKTNSL